MNGTWKAILGCVLALLLLGGLVTYFESRLPRALRAQAVEEGGVLKEDLTATRQLQGQIRAQLKAHGEVLGATASQERWEPLVDAAVEGLSRLDQAYGVEVGAFLTQNQREDEAALIALLDRLFKEREEITRSVAHLPERVKEVSELLPRAQAALSAFKAGLVEDAARVAALEGRVKGLCEQGEGVDAIVTRERWREAFATCSQALAAIEPEREAVEQVAAKQSVASAKEVLILLPKLEAGRSQATAPLRSLEVRVQSLADFLAKRSSYKGQLKADLEALSGLAWAGLEASAKAASERYPFNSEEILRRAAAAAAPAQRAQVEGAAALADLARPLSEVDPARVVRGVDAVAKARAKSPGAITACQGQLASLDLSREKVLVDMELKEGYEVTFHQLFRESEARRGGQVSGKEAWVKVSEVAYKSLEPYLGLTVESKPFGYFADQSAKAPASPAGMAYVGNPSYGEWQQDAWVFHSDAASAALVTRAWATFYAPVTRSDWELYTQRKAPWLGTDAWGHALYGSQGSLSAKLYAASRYLTNKGYAASKYKQSGGTYRGTRYERRSSGSTTVFVGGSRSSSSSSYSSRRSSSSSYRSSSTRSSTRTSSGK